jgi:hypothetical protein
VKQDNGVWPLLYYAITPSVIGKDFRLFRTVDQFPSKRMVKLLLDNGADPNRNIPHKKMTIWEALLLENHPKGAALDPWLDIVPDFIAHGADIHIFTTWSRDLRGIQVGPALANFRLVYLDQQSSWFGWNKSKSTFQNFEITEDDIENIKNHPSRYTATMLDPIIR